MKNILDISKHQSTYNAEVAKANGIDDVILRAAYGTGKDVKFDQFYSAAKAAGQTVGAYGFATWHYSSKNNGNIDTARAVMIEQIDAWIAICQDKLDGYFAIDQELEQNCTMGLTKAQNVILLEEAIARLEAVGLCVCAYCSASWAMAHIDANALSVPLWLAYYYADPADPDFDDCADYTTRSGKYFDYMKSLNDKLCGWQFGRIGKGEKYGVGSVNVDKNKFYIYPTVKKCEPFSDQAVSIKVENYGDNLAPICQYIGSLNIVCDTSTLGDGYFVTGEASCGDQTRIQTVCAKYGATCEAYYEPISVKPIRMAIAWHTEDILRNIFDTLGKINLAGDMCILDGWVVTDLANAEQQQTLLEKIDAMWGNEWFEYTAPVAPDVDPEPPQVDKPAEPTPEPEETPAPETEVPEPKPELDKPEAVGIIDKFLKLLLDWLINYFNKGA